MKKKKTNLATPARRFPRSLLIVTAIAVVALAAMTVVSRQSAGGRETNEPTKVTTAMANKNAAVKVAAQDMPVDSQGQIRPLTPDEAKKLAEGLNGMLNKSSEGLVEQHNADGSVEMDLQGRFQSVAVARVNKDGSVTESCVDNPRAAGAFFGIDPKTIRPESGRTQPRTQPNPQ
jgi:hypothetical protein